MYASPAIAPASNIAPVELGVVADGSDLTGVFDWARLDLTGMFDWARLDLTGVFD